MASLVRRRCSWSRGYCLVALLALATLSCPGHFGAAAAAGEGGSGGKWHVVSVSSLLPGKVCTATEAPPNPTALSVVHRHGPCSPRRSRGDPPPSHAEILGRDRERVAAIHRKVGRAAASQGANATLQAHWGKPLGTSNYFISVGLGTPARDLCVEFDTGSDQSWVQCKPCGDCYEQRDPLFDPEGSSTYAAVSCGAQECREFGSRNCSSSSDDEKCRYEVSYSDQSRTVGNLARDTLALTPTAAVPGFVFGCGHKDAGVFGEVDGLVGLGRGKASLASQAAAQYGAGFSYCLPSSPSTVGYLTFGAAASAPANAQFMAMVTGQHDDASFYYLNLTGVKVAGRAVKVPLAAFATAAGTIIDSGTAFSRFPPRAYAALRSAFRRAMGGRYRRAPAPAPFDTCYDLAGHEAVRVPSVALVFDGGATVVDLDPSGVLYEWDSVSQACLAFAHNPDEAALGVLGNVQQRTLAVVYDVGNEKIGFAAKGCAKSFIDSQWLQCDAEMEMSTILDLPNSVTPPACPPTEIALLVQFCGRCCMHPLSARCKTTVQLAITCSPEVKLIFHPYLGSQGSLATK
ncbi:protein ASPARTIC PROTEASE IN GUARD CELL 2-like [Panicum miliaceum]|uniref:Protein ASPARTIC PROTEASE IN GUARD CELL 2-like n=1 Tax=Panicum miliaceum TaxID=4540 RepID=A0A3L6TDP5_PANMI|nr:protein ASPARTIC PROTEASE IN GUARD CELL 2-like [Panicum miliaceum]